MKIRLPTFLQTFDEWKSWYEAHAEPANPIEGASLYFEPEHGFFYYKVFSGGVLYIDHFATGDYQYLFRRAREMARREHSEERFDVRWSCLRAGKTMTVSTKKKQEPMHAVKVTIQPRYCIRAYAYSSRKRRGSCFYLKCIAASDKCQRERAGGHPEGRPRCRRQDQQAAAQGCPRCVEDV